MTDNPTEAPQEVTFTCRLLSDNEIAALKEADQYQGPVPGILGPDEKALALYLETADGEKIHGTYAITTRKDPS